MVHKDYKNRFLKSIFPICRMNFRIQHLTCPLINRLSPSITILLWSPSHASFLIVSSISFWSHTCWSMACCFRSLSRNTMQVEVSELKIISLYFLIVPLTASSSSSFVFMQFRLGIFNFFASSNSNVLLLVLYPWAGYKNLLDLLFTPHKIHHHHSTYCILGFLHQCIYTL